MDAVPGPPLPEQRRIAEVLDAVDGAIRATEAVVAKLRLVEVGVRQDSVADLGASTAPGLAGSILTACADRIRVEGEVLCKLHQLQEGLLSELMSRRS